MKLMQLVPINSTQTDPRINFIHKCQLPVKTSLVEALIPGNNLWIRFKRWIIQKCILSREHPFAKNSIKSTAGNNYEINRHIINYSYTIHPFSEFRNVWELFMVVFMLVSLIVLPFIVAFYFEDPRDWFEVLLIINVVFISDTVLCFFTGYFDSASRTVILDKKLIIKKYLLTFFILDFISALPLQLMFTVMIMMEYREPDWYWTSFSLLKIIRIRNLINYCRNIKQQYNIKFQTYKIMEMTIILILCIHWATCLELYVPSIGEKIDSQNPDRKMWLVAEDTKNATSRIYILCMSRATISLSASSHYRDMKMPEDIMLNIFLTILGRIGFIYILAQFLMLMATFHSTKKKIVKSLQQLQEYMQYKELPRVVQYRILTYYTYWSNKSYKRDKLIISNVSPNLRQELLMHTCTSLMENVEFFKHLPHTILSQLVLLLKAEIYLADDVIVKCGTIGDALYYIVSGTVAVYSDRGEKICNLEDGSYFGEIALVMEKEKRLSTIIAIETCEVYVLKRTDFTRVISDNPHLMSQLQKLAIEKLETSPFEMIHKCEGSMSTNIKIAQSENPEE